jgi:hypothetical protein
VSELIDLAQKLSGASFAVLMFLILAGSYFDKWCWSRDREAMKQERDVIRAALEDDRNAWKRIALQNTGLVEKAVDRASRTGSLSAGGRESA